MRFTKIGRYVANGASVSKISKIGVNNFGRVNGLVPLTPLPHGTYLQLTGGQKILLFTGEPVYFGNVELRDAEVFLPNSLQLQGLYASQTPTINNNGTTEIEFGLFDAPDEGFFRALASVKKASIEVTHNAEISTDFDLAIPAHSGAQYATLYFDYPANTNENYMNFRIFEQRGVDEYEAISTALNGEARRELGVLHTRKQKDHAFCTVPLSAGLSITGQGVQDAAETLTFRAVFHNNAPIGNLWEWGKSGVSQPKNTQVQHHFTIPHDVKSYEATAFDGSGVSFTSFGIWRHVIVGASTLAYGINTFITAAQLGTYQTNTVHQNDDLFLNSYANATTDHTNIKFVVRMRAPK